MLVAGSKDYIPQERERDLEFVLQDLNGVDQLMYLIVEELRKAKLRGDYIVVEVWSPKTERSWGEKNPQKKP